MFSFIYCALRMASSMNKRKHQESVRHIFEWNTFKIIEEMLKVRTTENQAETTALVDEALHSIFFLGQICGNLSPEEIIPDEELLKNLKEAYPRPFTHYLTHLPQRSPFSCVLDIIVLQKGRENDEQIKKSLQHLVKSLKPGYLFSNTICISQKSNNSTKYYGVSMSTTGVNAGSIVIAASCFNNWHEYVSGAVMTYYPEKVKKNYFDGTIQVPQYVRCKAFKIKQGTELPPCRSCHNLFGLDTKETNGWPYGNCAEAESLSNLLKNEEQVKNKTHVRKHSAEDRKKAKKEVRSALKAVFKRTRTEHSFTWNDNDDDDDDVSLMNKLYPALKA